MRSALLLCLLLTLLMLPAQVRAQDEEYDMDFDIPEVEEQSGFEFWGKAELRAYSKFLDEDSALYKQKYYNKEQENPAYEFLLQVKPELQWERDEFGVYIRPRIEVGYSQMAGGSSAAMDEPSESLFDSEKYWNGKILAEEALLSWTPSPSLALEGGKKVLKWGKGYAWNPTAFLARPKDVNDPDQSREGYWMGMADFISSREGPVSTIAFTPVISTVSKNVNEDLADADTTVFGGKLYVLAYDTDFDLMVVAGDKYDTRIGGDFATNLAENLELHGEVGLRMGYEKTMVDASGNRSTENLNALSFLLGVRYLTETDTTFFVEYYHNGEGYSQSELRRYYTLIDDGYDLYQSTSNASLLKASSKVSSHYNKSSVGRDYLYFRVSQKEPFDILYLTPTLTSIVNLGDGSFTLNPEVAYLYSSSLEIRPRMTIPIGPAKSEFGEKVNRVNAELRLTYFF